MGRTAPPTTAPDPARAQQAPGSVPCRPDDRELCLGQVRVAATVAERERLARELHDAPAQVLASVHLRLRGLEGHPELAELSGVRAQLDEIATDCVEALRELREEIRGLRECCRDDRPLPELLESLTARFSRSSGIDAELCVDTARAHDLEPDVVLHVGRIMAEALTNVRKHAAARAVTVRVEQRGGQLVASVEDDGRGFTPPAGADGVRFGLAVMHERAELAGGRLEVGPRPGGGTRVRLTLPEPPRRRMGGPVSA